MMRVRLTIARSLREYAPVIVDAMDPEIATAYVEALLAGTDYDAAYCNMVNTVSWDVGGPSFDEDVIEEGEEHDDPDEEADVTVPEGWQPPPAPAPAPAPTATWWIVTLREHGDDEDTLVIVEGADEDAAITEAKAQFGHSCCTACGNLPCLDSCGACEYPEVYLNHVVRCGTERPIPTHAQPSS